ncbi:ATP-binding protein [Streptomyces sp. NPDC087850]|uniref:ATP-binding protein n=1 Tax=Streptomyces sp. NPDC087850 TaxID=3365809 RepID=UPI003805BBE3
MTTTGHPVTTALSACTATARTDLARHPRAARRARTWARAALCHWQITGEQASDVEVVLSEFVTNSLLHACGGIRAELGLLSAGGIRVEVHDDGPAAQCTRADQEDHGRGLQITTALAVHSGWDGAADHSTAWATLPAARL